ncbi:MAG TPA: sodium-translocating pyrophosphatase, partial [Clostridiales bacterium]|nr:sodium-translocating pyrophosphatase [Clostridiales bacterium]
MNTQVWLYLGMGLGIIAFLIALAIFQWVNKQDAGSETARRITKAIREGAWAYLRRLYSALAGVAIVFGIILAIVFSFEEGSFGILVGLETAGAYIVGALCSAVAGYLGMSVAVRANVRTSVAAKKSLNAAFNVAYRAGAVLALAMVGIAVFGMCLIYILTGNPEVVLGFSFGASSLALLAKAGGGIYTKTADIAADLVGKVEAGIPEDDPRNPAVIADNVGDNVGDVAGMGADIFDSYVAATVATMLIGFTGFLTAPAETRIFYTVLPLILCIVGIISSIIGLQLVKVGKNGKPGTALNMATVITCLIFGVLATILFVVMKWNFGALIATVSGLLIGVIIGFTTDYFTDDNFHPVRRTAEIAKSGSALNIITGLSYGFISIAPSLIGIAVATVIAYFSAQAFGLPGVYGVGIAAVGMLSLTGIVVANDAYGPIVDNAKGIAEMSGMGDEIVTRCDVLDSAGNTAKAITKGFAISAAALTVLALFVSYKEQIEQYLPEGKDLVLSLLDPLVLAGILLGAM